jgi:hypothetical protein
MSIYLLILLTGKDRKKIPIGSHLVYIKISLCTGNPNRIEVQILKHCLGFNYYNYLSIDYLKIWTLLVCS